MKTYFWKKLTEREGACTSDAPSDLIDIVTMVTARWFWTSTWKIDPQKKFPGGGEHPDAPFGSANVDI